MLHQESQTLDKKCKDISFEEQFNKNKRILSKDKWFELKKEFDGIKEDWENGFDRPHTYRINNIWNLYFPNNPMPQKK